MSGASSNLLRHVQHLVDVHRIGSLSDDRLLERFATQRDETAFEVLVRQHGPMVLSVCHRVLGHEQDAEDVFQATFLILARKAGTIRQTNVGGFLYRVAYHLAVRARGDAVKRRRRDQRAAAPPSQDLMTEVTWRELRQVVDEELQRLPEAARSALVLCYLEGKTLEEAAQLLNWSKSTLRRRLNHGRELLRRRLLARGLAPMAALTASLFAEEAASAMPATLVSATVRAAAAGSVSPAIAALVEAGVALVSFGKVNVVMVLLLAMSLLGGAGVWMYRGMTATTPSQPAQPPAAKAESKPPTADAPYSAKRQTEKTNVFQGRVLGPDGKPRAGAKLALLGQNGVSQVGVTAADGRFAVVVPKEKKGEWPPALLAHYRDAGLEFISLAGRDAAKPVELRLVKDQAIRGRVVNTEGKPISGVRVSVSSIDVFHSDSLESLLFRSQKSPADFVLPPGEKTLLLHPASLLDAVTDAGGAFCDIRRWCRPCRRVVPPTGRYRQDEAADR